MNFLNMGDQRLALRQYSKEERLSYHDLLHEADKAGRIHLRNYLSNMFHVFKAAAGSRKKCCEI